MHSTGDFWAYKRIKHGWNMWRPTEIMNQMTIDRERRSRKNTRCTKYENNQSQTTLWTTAQLATFLQYDSYIIQNEYNIILQQRHRLMIFGGCERYFNNVFEVHERMWNSTGLIRFKYFHFEFPPILAKYCWIVTVIQSFLAVIQLSLLVNIWIIQWNNRIQQ